VIAITHELVGVLGMTRRMAPVRARCARAPVLDPFFGAVLALPLNGRRARLADQTRSLYDRLRPLIFALDPEGAHRVTLALLRAAGPRPGILGQISGAARALDASRRAASRSSEVGGASALPSDPFARTIAGIGFPNPVGLAAGYDKDAVALSGLAALGFGFLEIGTVTPRPQEGNPRPRVARLTAERGLANALGFPNAGAAVVARRIAATRAESGWRAVAVPIGISIGKMRETRIEDAAADYVACLEIVSSIADFIVINVSSPNTPGLTRLQETSRIDALLDAVVRANRAHTEPRPLFAKLSPDLEPALLDELVDLAIARGLAGLVLTNTLPVERAGLLSQSRFGLSGAPIRERSLASLTRARERAGGRLALIGVGGIMSGADAALRLRAGADLVQLYTGLVYEGPALIGRALAAIAAGTR
jgi:dihydroorotate dehydrogenase